ncbi:MAG: hypothetical protein KF805_10745 [Phycisphaeraceae bacterium]|nr:hypothetical protein [Phycisphaeraceae bacterium]
MSPNDPHPAKEKRSGEGAGAPGLVHTYLGYDPKNFPSPTAEPPDLASAAMEHMLAYGSTRDLTPEELANAIRLDPSMFPRLGPSLDSLIAMLEERKQRILETYEVDSARKAAAEAYKQTLRDAKPPAKFRSDFEKFARTEQIRELERLWEAQKDDNSPFAQDLMRVTAALGDRYQLDQLVGKYAFTGREKTDIERAIELKDELETIDRLLSQLREAMKNAQLAIIDLDELSQFADSEDIENINDLQKQIEDYLRQEMERQGIEQSKRGLSLTPKAAKIFQTRVLSEIFSELQAARSGRHSGPIYGEGAVELPRTKQYEFGDSIANIDAPGSFINAAIRTSREAGTPAPGQRRRLRLDQSDIEIHRTRNNPRCASCVLLDMSGSMRYGGQYIDVKRMGMALDGLIRSEYPGDFLRIIEMYTFAKVRPVSELPTLMPKMVSIHNPVVRLKADMSDPDVVESRVPQHFTNIQRALQLARQLLAAQDTPNRQVMLITDGLPTAHFEGSDLYMLYPPDPRTEEATMREAQLCSKENITINIFLLPSWSQTQEDIRFAQKMAQATGGRVFFTGGKDLDRFVLWDYVNQRRKIIG